MKNNLHFKPQALLLSFILFPVIFTLISVLTPLFSSEALAKRTLEEKCGGLIEVMRIKVSYVENRREGKDEILIMQYDAVVKFRQNTIFEMSRKGFQEAIVRIEKGTKNYYNLVKGKVIKIRNGVFILKKENGKGKWELI